MDVNIGDRDRIIRIVVGLSLIAFALLSESEYAVWGWIGVLPVITGLVRYCPGYSLMGIKTVDGKKGG